MEILRAFNHVGKIYDCCVTVVNGILHESNAIRFEQFLSQLWFMMDKKGATWQRYPIEIEEEIAMLDRVGDLMSVR